MYLDIVCMVINLNSDDVRRITLELLYDLELVKATDIEKVSFIDDVAKEEILNRKVNYELAVQQII